MKVLSQRDPKWAKQKLGKCGCTLGSHGCAVTSVAMIAGTTPDKVNAKKPFVGKCMDIIDWSIAAKQWKLNYSPVRNKVVKYPCIAEVKLGKGQHFIVLDGKNQLDPWTGKVTKGYKIISYRNITQRPVKKVVTPIVTPTPKVTPVTPPKIVVEKPTENLKEVIKVIEEKPIMKYTLTKENLVKIAKGAGIALGGALLTFLADLIPTVDFGAYTPLVVALAGILINAGRQFIKE